MRDTLWELDFHFRLHDQHWSTTRMVIINLSFRHPCWFSYLAFSPRQVIYVVSTRV